MRRKPGFFDYARANGTKSTDASVSTGRRSIGAAFHTKLPDHRSALAGVTSSILSVLSMIALTYNVTWESNAYLLGQRENDGVYEGIKSYRPPEKRVGRASLSEIHSRAFVLRTVVTSERAKWFSRENETERDKSTRKVVEGAQKMRSRNEAAESGETIARPCVKNEDIQMEI